MIAASGSLLPGRSRAVGKLSGVAFAVDRRPNSSVERTRRFVASFGPASGRRAAHLPR